MTVTHVGSTRKYSSNWDSIFTGSKRRSATATAAGAVKKATPKKKSAKKKSTAKKTGRKK